MDRPVLRLFVAGRTPRSERAIRNLELVCQESAGEEPDVSIIDVLEHPEIAEDQKILVTPTLVKESPPPVRRIIGDLSDTAKVVTSLNLGAATEAEDPGS